MRAEPLTGSAADALTGSAADALTGPAADALFTALADPTRRRILQRLCTQPDDAGSVGRDLGISRQAAAKHLKVLEDVGLVSGSRTSRRRVHTPEPHRIREVSDLLGAVARGWERRLDDLRQRAEAAAREGAAAQDGR